jgi:spore coat polysaccharide biosynthesis protein SpsF
MTINAFVQARMSSHRFPGKVLAPFRGEPIVLHVVRAAERAVDNGKVVVATSDQPSDDPLAAYLASVAVPCFRGPCDDVLRRFQLCARAHPCTWVLRLSADSPMLDPAELAAVVAAAAEDVDLASTAPSQADTRGRNAELIRTSALLALDARELVEHDREHVTPFFYAHPDRFRIAVVDLPPRAGGPLTVDTVEDLARLEAQ